MTERWAAITPNIAKMPNNTECESELTAMQNATIEGSKLCGRATILAFLSQNTIFFILDFLPQKYENYRWTSGGIVWGVEQTKVLFKIINFIKHYFYIVPQDELFGDDYFHRTYYIPTVGINAKFHILPFIVKDTKNRWEWYVIAKYGGGFVKNVPHWAHHNGTPEYYDKVYKLYRHEFGVGMGVGVFFWDCLGLFAEQSIGQFSLFPEDFNSILSTRVGIQVKF